MSSTPMSIILNIYRHLTTITMGMVGIGMLISIICVHVLLIGIPTFIPIVGLLAGYISLPAIGLWWIIALLIHETRKTRFILRGGRKHSEPP